MRRNNIFDQNIFNSGVAALVPTLNAMGYEELRPGQMDPIMSIFACKDTIFIAPTALGKSLVAALPTKALKWHTLVFSPLVALMDNQVNSMCAKGITAAACVSTNPDIININNIERWRKGEIDMLYVAPERVKNEALVSALKACPPDMIVMDECHMLSLWGANFRPDYARCGDIINLCNPKVVLAMTATATKEIISDVQSVLNMQGCNVIKHYAPRLNLNLFASKCSDEDLFVNVLRKVREVKGSAIVYCSTIKTVTELAEFLSINGESVTAYHGSMDDNAKISSLNAFVENGEVRICVATNAFGMGIDKPDVEAVIHASMPNSLEAVAQETGRAARDGRQAICHMFDTPNGRRIQEMFWTNGNPTASLVSRVFAHLVKCADKEKKVRKTTTQLGDELHEFDVKPALSLLEYMGCISREKSKGELYTILLTGELSDTSKKRWKELYNLIKDSVGFKIDKTRPLYEVDLQYLAKKVGLALASVKTNITAMGKANLITYTLPYRGDIITLLNAPTKAQLEFTDARRQKEHSKLMQVREYITIKDKQQFLFDYFDSLEV